MASILRQLLKKRCCKRESESCSVVFDSLQPHGLYNPWNSPGQNTGVGSLSFLLWMFPTQGSNPGLPHCRQILYYLSHQGRLESILSELPGKPRKRISQQNCNSKRYMYPSVQSSTIHNSQDMETT